MIDQSISLIIRVCIKHCLNSLKKHSEIFFKSVDQSIEISPKSGIQSENPVLALIPTSNHKTNTILIFLKKSNTSKKRDNNLLNKVHVKKNRSQFG